MIHSFTITFGAKYLTGIPPYEIFSFIKNNILHQSTKITQKIQISEVCDL